jgi:hypothetical protein
LCEQGENAFLANAPKITESERKQRELSRPWKCRAPASNDGLVGSCAMFS